MKDVEVGPARDARRLKTVMKTQVEELAILGGVPAFPETLHVGRPIIGDRRRLWARINDVLSRRWLTNNGPYLQEFEQRIADRTGAAHCVAMSNGTMALEVAIRALGLAGEVIVPSFTFIATAHALQWQGIRPVFCDVDPLTHTLDACSVSRSITPRTTGILAVHLWGNPCDIDELEKIAHQHKLKLLFDASHAFGTSYKGKAIGNFGEVEVFSFHATKVLNTFEGGAAVTNDPELAAKMRSMRNFGFSGLDETLSIGTNAKMNEVSAAMGLTGLEGIDETIAINYRHYKRYSERLADIPGISLLSHNEKEQNNYHYIALEIDASRAGISRNDLIRVLHAENIFARRYFFPGCHRLEPYRSLYPQSSGSLSETEKLSERTLCLPTGPALDAGDVDGICQILRLAVNHALDLAGRSSRKLTPRQAPRFKNFVANGVQSNERMTPSGAKVK
jgi:dTDP-4-amino-4,6-dideoxygalactose transaminase